MRNAREDAVGTCGETINKGNCIEEGDLMPRELTEQEALERAERFSEKYVSKGPYEFFPEPEVVQDSPLTPA